MRSKKWYALAGGIAAAAVTGGLLVGSDVGAQGASVSFTVSAPVEGELEFTVSGECTGARFVTDEETGETTLEPAPPQNIAVFLTTVPVEGNVRPTEFIATAFLDTPDDFLDPTWPWSVTLSFPADAPPAEGDEFFVSAFCNHPASQSFATGSFSVGAPAQPTTTTTTTTPPPSPGGTAAPTPPTPAPATPVEAEPTLTG